MAASASSARPHRRSGVQPKILAHDPKVATDRALRRVDDLEAVSNRWRSAVTTAASVRLLAAAIGVSKSTVGNWIDPKHPSLPSAMQREAIRKRCRRVYLELHRLEALRTEPTQVCLNKRLLMVAREKGRLSEELLDAQSDGRIDRSEAQRLRSHLIALRAQLDAFEADLEAAC